MDYFHCGACPCNDEGGIMSIGWEISSLAGSIKRLQLPRVFQTLVRFRETDNASPNRSAGQSG